jgi:sugar phosphate isomerase/epimerase
MKAREISMSRRDFTKLSAIVTAGVPLMGFSNTLHNLTSKASDAIQVNLFSKHLQFLDYDEMSAAAADMGFNGLDLTVRPKGHVWPEKVVADLPKAVAAMKKYGLRPQLMTTNVWDSSSAVHKTVLEAASNLGFTHYRTDWLKYDEHKNLKDSQRLFGEQARALELVNKRFGIVGCYQNHAGKNVGAPIWDLSTILSAAANEFMGCQYDIRHAVVEGGTSWELGLRLIKPYVKSIVIKDFKWAKVNGKWKPVHVPLGEGMVDFNRYFSLLKAYDIQVPVSLHVEHDLGGAERGASTINISKKEVFLRIKKDLTFLKEAWKKA